MFSRVYNLSFVLGVMASFAYFEGRCSIFDINSNRDILQAEEYDIKMTACEYYSCNCLTVAMRLQCSN